jgi:V-type H+-transporting ATPase subunit a
MLSSHSHSMTAITRRLVSGHDNIAIISEIPVHEWPSEPPTHFSLSPLTRSYQHLVNSYGTPRYKELNPALFSCVTFPFLFGVMYGDVGHGLALLCFSIYLILFERSLRKFRNSDIFCIIFNGRYILAGMGFFSIYCGFIYNEFFGFPLDLFGSRYRGGVKTKNPNTSYPFGVDPAWRHASNGLQFLNSLRMKLSIILGVCHMMLGLGIKFVNGLHFKRCFLYKLSFSYCHICDLFLSVHRSPLGNTFTIFITIFMHFLVAT